MLVYRYEIPSLAVVPHLFEDISAEECSYMRVAPSDRNLFETFKDLRSVKEKLNKVYFSQFLANLQVSSLDRPDRYKNEVHVKLKPNDLVVIRQPQVKPYNCPLGIAISVETNDLQEVNTVQIPKSNGMIIRRHVSDLILLESSENLNVENCKNQIIRVNSRPSRSAGRNSIFKTKQLYGSGLA